MYNENIWLCAASFYTPLSGSLDMSMVPNILWILMILHSKKTTNTQKTADAEISAPWKICASSQEKKMECDYRQK